MLIKNYKYFKIENLIRKAGDVIHSPEQRLILGVTALATQPFIDLNNKKADEDTRILSTCRTIAKIIAGTTSGIAVRAGCIKLAEHLSKEGGILNPKKLAQKSIDELKTKITDLNKKDIEKKIEELTEIITRSDKCEKYQRAIKNYGGTIGTFAAIGVMLVTNFLWDAPVAKSLTNFFYKKASKKESK